MVGLLKSDLLRVHRRDIDLECTVISYEANEVLVTYRRYPSHRRSDCRKSNGYWKRKVSKNAKRKVVWHPQRTTKYKSPPLEILFQLLVRINQWIEKKTHSRISLSINGALSAAALLSFNPRYAVKRYRTVCKTIGGTYIRQVFTGVGAIQPISVMNSPGVLIDLACRSLNVNLRRTASASMQLQKQRSTSTRARLLCR